LGSGIRHDEADAWEQFAGVVVDFRHDSFGRGPAVRLIMEALVPDERARLGRRPKQDVFDLQLQILVGRDADGVAHAACLQRLVDRRPREVVDGEIQKC